MRRRPVLGNAMWLGAPFALAAVYAVTWSDWLFWLLATSYLTAETWFGQRSEGAREEHDPPESRLELGALLALCALAALLTSGVRRPDADDAYYLSVATAALEFPDAAPLSLDTLHRSGLPPLEQTQWPEQSQAEGRSARSPASLRLHRPTHIPSTADTRPHP